MTTITSTVVDRAEVRFREADAALRPYVGCFWAITAGPDATIRIVPDGSTSISAALPSGAPADWEIRGPLVRPDERRFPSPTTLVGVRLRPGVAFLLSGIAADRMVGKRVALSDLALFDALTTGPAADDPDHAIDRLERFLIARLANSAVHFVVATALREIERDHGCASVEDIASRCGVSTRHLNRLMRTWVGYGPKAFARIVRFQATLREMHQAPARSGAALATDAGYFDQAHLATDVGRFAGATPRHVASRAVSDFSKTRCDDLP